MNPIDQFNNEVKDSITRLGNDEALKTLTWDWIKAICPYSYTHNFSWMDRPIIQFPQDIVAMQEIIWKVKPNLIIETGIAHGGSIILSASMLALLDYQDAFNNNTVLDPRNPSRRVLGIDIDIRDHNRREIESHPMSSRIDMIQGSSIDEDIIGRVHEFASKFERVLVILDSNHTHEHVLAELEAYAPLTTVGSYCIVFDTAIEDVPADFFPDRPWGPGDNPKTAVWEYLKAHNEFEVDKNIQNKLLITVAPDGYLKRIM